VVEHLTFNQGVARSIRAGRTIFPFCTASHLHESESHLHEAGVAPACFQVAPFRIHHCTTLNGTDTSVVSHDIVTIPPGPPGFFVMANVN
jgi:hypothetical protein